MPRAAVKYKWTVLSVTTVGVLVSGIDSRILVVGLPQIAASINADAEQAVWFTQGYALASTLMLLLIGRITDIFGRVKLFKVGFVIFTLGSLLTSLSQSPDQIITFRIIQGLGASTLWTNSIAMITDATPAKELGFSMGINQIASRLGSVLGLTVSGLILFFFDWRALFYINIPIGIFGTLWAHFRLKEVGTYDRGSRVDWPGFLAFSSFLTGLLLSLTFAAYGAAEASAVGLLLFVSTVSLFAFIIQEKRSPHPLLDLKLLRIKEFSASTVALMINVTATSSLLLLLSLYLQLILGFSPFDAGVRLIPLDLALVCTAPFSGMLSDRLGKTPFMLSGLVLTSVSTFLFTTVGVETPYPILALYLAMLGFASGIFLSPNSSWAITPVPPNRRGVASSLRGTVWNVGLTLSFNLAIWIMTFTVPYGVITGVIASGSASSVSAAFRALFLGGLRNAYVWLALLNISGLFPTLFALWRTRVSRSPATLLP